MPGLINLLQWGKQSSREIVVRTVTMEEIPSGGTNTVNSALRFNRANSADTGTDISSKVSISGNIVTVSNIWTASETAAEGSYKVRVVVRDASATERRQEFNAYVDVTDD